MRKVASLLGNRHSYLESIQQPGLGHAGLPAVPAMPADEAGTSTKFHLPSRQIWDPSVNTAPLSSKRKATSALGDAAGAPQAKRTRSDASGQASATPSSASAASSNAGLGQVAGAVAVAAAAVADVALDFGAVGVDAAAPWQDGYMSVNEQRARSRLASMQDAQVRACAAHIHWVCIPHFDWTFLSRHLLAQPAD